MSQFPSGEKATLNTKSLWPLNVDLRLEPDKSHSLSVLSREPDANDFPSGENATLYTESACPSYLCVSQRTANNTNNKHWMCIIYKNWMCIIKIHWMCIDTAPKSTQFVHPTISQSCPKTLLPLTSHQ